MIYSDFAKNFLRYYSGNESMYLACKKSREILDKVLTVSSAQDEAELFGISFDFNYGFGPGMLRCFDRDVFRLLINEMPVAVEGVPDELRRNGVKLYYAEKRDVNFNGLAEEWLMIIADGMFALFPNKLHYEVVELDYFWYGEDTSKYSDTTVAIERWNGIQGSVLIILADQDMVIKSIGEDYRSIWLNSEYDVEDVIFSPKVAPAQFQVSYKEPASKEAYYVVPWKGYRWDAARSAFRDDLIEYSLFVEHNPDKAVEMAEMLVPLLLDWKDLDLAAGQLPRYFYLCGLSYELSGDVQKAAEVYWQLWRDYPESQYALLARYKLMPVNP